MTLNKTIASLCAMSWGILRDPIKPLLYSKAFSRPGHDHRHRRCDHGSAYFYPDSEAARSAIHVYPHMVYVDSSKPELVEVSPKTD